MVMLAKSSGSWTPSADSMRVRRFAGTLPLVSSGSATCLPNRGGALCSRVLSTLLTTGSRLSVTVPSPVLATSLRLSSTAMICAWAARLSSHHPQVRELRRLYQVIDRSLHVVVHRPRDGGGEERRVRRQRPGNPVPYVENTEDLTRDVRRYRVRHLRVLRQRRNRGHPAVGVQ